MIIRMVFLSLWPLLPWQFTTTSKSKAKTSFINVMNNMSVDCDCDDHPAAPRIRDIGILASTDPVALDKACLDLVFGHIDSRGDDAKPLRKRINSLHGTHIVEYAESIGLGVQRYNLVNIDE